MKIRWLVIVILCVFSNIYFNFAAAYPLRTAFSAGPRDPGEPQSPRNPPQPPAVVTGAFLSANLTAHGSRPLGRRRIRKGSRHSHGLQYSNRSRASAGPEFAQNVNRSRVVFENIPLASPLLLHPELQTLSVAEVNVTPFPVVYRDETWQLGGNPFRLVPSDEVGLSQNWDGTRIVRSANGTHQFHNIFHQRFVLYSASAGSVLVINADSTVTTQPVEGSAAQNINPKALLNIFTISNLSAKTVLQSLTYGLFLCLDRRGRLYASCAANPECEFRYNFQSTNYNTIESWLYERAFVSVSPEGIIRRAKPHYGPLGMEHSFLPIPVSSDKADEILKAYYEEDPNRLQHCANYNNSYVPKKIFPARTISHPIHNHRHRHRGNFNNVPPVITTERRERPHGNGRRHPAQARHNNQTAEAVIPSSPPRRPALLPSVTRPPHRTRLPISQSPRNRHPNRRPIGSGPTASVQRPWQPSVNSTTEQTPGGGSQISTARRRCRVENGREKCKVVKKKRCRNRKCREKRRRRRKMRKLRNSKNIPQQCRHLENMERRVCLRQNRKRLRKNNGNSVNSRRRVTSTTTTTTSTTTTTTTTTSTTPAPTLLLNNDVLPYYDRNNEENSHSNGISMNTRLEGPSVSNDSSERWPFPRTPSWSTAQPRTPTVTSRKLKAPRKRSGTPSPGRVAGRRRRQKRPTERSTRPRGRNLLQAV